MARLSPVKGFQYPFQGVDNGLAAHALAVAGEAQGFAAHFLVARPGEAHGADRLVLAAAGRAGNAGDRERDGRLAAPERAERHFTRRLLAHRPMYPQGIGAHAEHLLLGAIRIRHETAVEPRRRSRHRGHDLRRPSAGAGLGGGKHRFRSLEALAEGLRKRLHQKKSFLARARMSSVYPAAARSSIITPKPPW